MHFVTLATVEIPHMKEDEKRNTEFAAEANKLKQKAEKDYMAAIYYRQIQNKLTTFSRAVESAVSDVMEPFFVNTDDPQYIEFEDYTEDVQEKYASEACICVRFPEGKIVQRSSHEFYSKYMIEDGVIKERCAGRLHSHKRTHKAKKLQLILNYPIRKLYPTIAEYAQSEGYYSDEESGRYGYMSNPNGHWDWYSIGGRWPDIFLVSDQCKEYSPGECDRKHRDAPAGYKWVSAARKKDIAWDVMRSWKKEMAANTYILLKQIFDTKERPDDFYGKIHDDGIYGPYGVMYINGESLNDYLNRYGIDVEDTRYPNLFYNFISDGEWFSTAEYEFGGKADEDGQEMWYNDLHDFIDGLSDETVLVVVDCHY